MNFKEIGMIQTKWTSSAATGARVVLAQLGKELPTQLADNEYVSKRVLRNENQVFSLTLDSNDLIVVLLGEKQGLSATNDLEDLRRLGAKACASLSNAQVETVHFESVVDQHEAIRAFLEGLLLATYRFETYKKEKVKKPLAEVSTSALDELQLAELQHVVEAVFFARDLVNEPVNTLTAPEFSKRMAEAGKVAGYQTTSLDKKAIESLKMGGLLGVNLGSIDPPTFNILEWKPEGAVNSQPLVFVGKGVVYDTGGNNLKPGGYMSDMKSDMGGGAAVTGAIYAIAKNKLPVWTISLIPATDNRIGKNALVADDIITISDGTTVEVKNTDAEGRLILSDALVYAKRYNPMLVVDMATLTGAADAITGPFGIAMTQDADGAHVSRVKEAGDAVYERVVELPFWREFDDLLKSNVADMSNLGGPKGGATTAGKFLHHFTNYNWIHLDIAGPAFLDKPTDYKQAGGTGVGVRLAYQLARSIAAE